VSHVDKGQYKGTCQTCGKPVRTRGVGTVWRHRTVAGVVCGGSNAYSVEVAAEIRAYEAERARPMVEWLLSSSDGAVGA
jgi:hypothetical protein